MEPSNIKVGSAHYETKRKNKHFTVRVKIALISVLVIAVVVSAVGWSESTTNITDTSKAVQK